MEIAQAPKCLNQITRECKRHGNLTEENKKNWFSFNEIREFVKRNAMHNNIGGSKDFDDKKHFECIKEMK